MARGRIISPDFWTDGKIILLSPFARLFFIGLWNFALCDLGHLNDDALGLKMKILPADPVDAGDLLNELMAAGRVERFATPEGKKFLIIPTFGDWQKADVRWNSRCPVCSAKPAETLPNSPKLSQTLPSLVELSQTLPNSALRGEERREEEKREKELLSDFFDSAFSAWPKQVLRKKAAAAFDVAARTYPGGPSALADVVTKYGTAYAATTPKQFTPALGVWLTGDRWTDELPAPRDQGRKPTRTESNLDFVAQLAREQSGAPTMELTQWTR